MPDQLQLRGGTTVQHSTFTGASKEVTVDTTKKTVVVHDGSTAGGNPMLREDASNSALALGSAGTPSLKFTGDTNTGIYSPGADQVAISTGGSGRLFVDASGNVGVGTAPSQLFHIAGASATALLAASSGVGTLRLTRGATTADLSVSTALATLATTSATDFAFSTNNTERLRITSTGTVNIVGAGTAGSTQAVSFNGSAPINSLVIDSSGRLGVGTSSPSANLESQGNVSSTTQFSGFQGLRIQNANGSAFGVTADINFVVGTGSDNRGAVIGAEYTSATSGNDLYFATNPNAVTTNDTPIERMRITSAGRVGIGTSSPGVILDIRETATGATTAISLFNTDNTNSTSQTARIGLSPDSRGAALAGLEVYKENADFSTSAARDVSLALNVLLNNAKSEAVRITSAGNVGIGTTSPVNPLDVNGNISTNGAFYAYNSAKDGLGIWYNPGGAGVNQLTARLGGSDRLTIDSSGRLLVGTSSYFDNGISADSQLLIANTTVGHIATTTWSASNNGAYLTLGRSRGTSIGSNTAVAENDELGVLAFAGDNGSSLVNRAAQIAAYVDGEVGTAGDTTDMPGRLVFSTSADGASSPTEQWRLTNDGVQALRQATPAAVDTTATLTVAQLKGRIITSSTAAAVTMTLPSGTDTEAGFSGIYTNMAFEWYVINTGATNAVTVQAGTAHTLVGSGSVAANTSGHFMSRRTAANTFVTYRLG